MDEIKKALDSLLKGTKNPTLTAIAAVIGLFAYFFLLVMQGKLRANRADDERDTQKVEDNSEIENTNAEADTSVRDRLNRPRANVTEV